jgi:hypothetical protein
MPAASAGFAGGVNPFAQRVSNTFVPPGQAAPVAPGQVAVSAGDSAKWAIPKEPYTTEKGVCIAELEINDYPEWARRQMAFGRNLKGVEEKTTAKCQLKGQHRLRASITDKEPQKDKLLYVEISGPTMAIVQRAKSAVHAMIEDFAKKTLQIGTKRA